MLSDEEQSFLIEMMFALLWTTVSQDDWDSVMSIKEEKRLDKIADKLKIQ